MGNHSTQHPKTARPKSQIRESIKNKVTMLLRGDVEEGKHSTMKPALLQQSRREYQTFKQWKFKERIYQEVRHVKFLSYLEQKRAEKGLK
jgi:hypothetical protein